MTKRHDVVISVALPVNAPDDMTSEEVADELVSIVEDLVVNKLVRLPNPMSSAAIAVVWADAKQVGRQKRSSRKRSSTRRR
jgi:hypothetical protein